MKKSVPINVPFDFNGNQKHCDYEYDKEKVFKSFSLPFQDELKFHDCYQNSSGVAAFDSRYLGGRVWMTNREFIRIIPKMINGVLTGEFRFTRHGKYFSIKLDDDTDA